jgi:type II restriction enzyme
MTENEILALAKALHHLSASQRDLVKRVMAQFALPHTFTRNPKSDWITQAVLEHFGDALRTHHALSRQALSKDRFEFALERALNMAGLAANLVASRTNRGHDITIAGVPVSLKTEASKGIKSGFIHVSKWMELGKGEWQLTILRDVFLDHMKNYERIFTLRCLQQGPSQYHYELVEIPKALMLEAVNCELELMVNSDQKPQPGYGRVFGPDRVLKYELYFDGGTERKLQIRRIDKNLCMVHATWAFEIDSNAL